MHTHINRQERERDRETEIEIETETQKESSLFRNNRVDVELNRSHWQDAMCNSWHIVKVSLDNCNILRDLVHEVCFHLYMMYFIC